MKIGPKYKICKRLGSNIFEKCQTKQFSLSSQRVRTDKKPKRAGSDFNRQLIEKQKLRLTYSLTERQFAVYVAEALGSGENPSQFLFARLETRLDSAIYRAGFALTRRAARQMASHGHIAVNGRRVTVPSYRLKVGDTLSIREGSRSGPLFENLSERLKEHKTPQWIQLDQENRTATMSAVPGAGEDSSIDFGAVFEYYTR